MRRKIQKAGMRCCPYKILILMAYTVKENKTVFSDKEDFIWKRVILETKSVDKDIFERTGKGA